MTSRLFFEYVSPEYEFAQYEAAGLSVRIGRRAWVFGSLDYREKTRAGRAGYAFVW